MLKAVGSDNGRHKFACPSARGLVWLAVRKLFLIGAIACSVCANAALSPAHREAIEATSPTEAIETKWRDVARMVAALGREGDRASLEELAERGRYDLVGVMARAWPEGRQQELQLVALRHFDNAAVAAALAANRPSCRHNRPYPDDYACAGVLRPGAANWRSIWAMTTCRIWRSTRASPPRSTAVDSVTFRPT